MIGAQVLINNARFTQFEQRQSRALDVAEAGINYYLWHLSHWPTDYKDGGSTPATAPYGPYVHNYYDNNGKLLGTYTLTITPPTNNSTITTVQSVGKVTGLTGTRTVLAQIGQPSFANFALLSNTQVWFGSNETTNGPVHSNNGVHFDGVNNGPVTSAVSSYTASSQFGGNGAAHCGVWGTGGPTSQWQPSGTYPTCSAPAVAIPFASVDVSALTTAAQAGSTLLPAVGTGYIGYRVAFKSTGGIDVYKVKSEGASGITTDASPYKSYATPPADGLIVAPEDIWVDGTAFPGRVTVVAAKPGATSSGWKSINITNNLTYKAKDGSSAIGLIAQNNVHIADYAPNTIEINAATLAVNGHVWVDSNAPVKNTITFYGSIATYDYWTWTWVSGNTTTAGYATTITNFDTHLIYSPPPLYPTTGTYSILNWREQLYNP
jgi:hypothetical protein